MSGEHLGKLGSLIAPRLLQMPRDREMAALAIPPRQRPIRRATQQALQEMKLAALRRQPIVVESDDLLGDQILQDFCDFLLAAGPERRDPRRGERAAVHRRVLQDRPLRCGQTVQASRRERVQRLRHLQLFDVARHDIAVALRREQPAIEQHPHGLNRIQRHPLRASEDLGDELARQPGHQPREQLTHRAVIQRPQCNRGRPTRTGAQQLGASEREDEKRKLGRPLKQVVDEVQQTAVGPLQILKRQHHRLFLGQPLKEQPPTTEKISAIGRGSLLEAEQVREARLDQPPLTLIAHMLRDSGAQLRSGCRGILFFQDPGASADHLRQRPVRHPLAVRETATLVPPADVLDPVQST